MGRIRNIDFHITKAGNRPTDIATADILRMCQAIDIISCYKRIFRKRKRQTADSTADGKDNSFTAFFKRGR